jgi:aryl-alcohol dehydrogenase-like predicted oxidoreductase
MSYYYSNSKMMAQKLGCSVAQLALAWTLVNLVRLLQNPIMGTDGLNSVGTCY